MSKIRILALMPVLALVLMGATECDPTNETCEVTGRDNTSVTLTCTDDDGNKTTDVRDGIGSDLYMKCQIGTFWPGCKTA